jgi:MFS superfamily sulfate permease-like transporter
MTLDGGARGGAGGGCLVTCVYLCIGCTVVLGIAVSMACLFGLRGQSHGQKTSRERGGDTQKQSKHERPELHPVFTLCFHCRYSVERGTGRCLLPECL